MTHFTNSHLWISEVLGQGSPGLLLWWMSSSMGAQFCFCHVGYCSSLLLVSYLSAFMIRTHVAKQTFKTALFYTGKSRLQTQKAKPLGHFSGGAVPWWEQKLPDVLAATHGAGLPASVCRGNSRELCMHGPRATSTRSISKSNAEGIWWQMVRSTGNVHPALFGLYSETILG